VVKKLDYTEYRLLKERIYDTLDGQNDAYSKQKANQLMVLLEEERIIKLKEESDEPEKEKKPKPEKTPDRGRYQVERPKAKLSCGCVFDYGNPDDDEFCVYHRGNAVAEEQREKKDETNRE
jgi:hypothetical protein